MNYKTKSEEETKSIAMNVAEKLNGGELILLYGDLGAGKTVFAKGLAKGLGLKQTIKSPTFNIMKLYNLPQRNGEDYLCHIDAYRLEALEELLDIGVEDYLNNKNIVVVEWPNKVKGIEKLGKKIIKIKIKHKKDEEIDA